ncbi:DUF4116 domain-containing protein [Candidatus Woesearchaeota archaeon]|nr:DUF4116 domain-containing protein [Candidatus Woesearchaeota archaeon]
MSLSEQKNRAYLADLNKVKKDPSHLRNVDNQDEAMCLEAVTRNGLTLVYVKYQTEDVRRAAVGENPHALNFVDVQSEEVCVLAVEEDGLCLQYVEDKTPYLCKVAVSQNGNALKFVPKDLQTEELYKIAIKNDPTMLQEIDNQTEEICLIAINTNPESIVYVKEQTPTIIKAALNHPNFTQSFIDFDKFKIIAIKNKQTGEVYNLDNAIENDYIKPKVSQYDLDSKQEPEMKQETANSSVVENENHSPVVETSATYEINFSADKHKMIIFKDLRKEKTLFINNVVSIQNEIEKLIKRKYGRKCLEKALTYFANRSTLDMIKNDETFDEGAFFIKNDENNYDLWLKTTNYRESGWFTTVKVRESSILKIREYSVVEEEN